MHGLMESGQLQNFSCLWDGCSEFQNGFFRNHTIQDEEMRLRLATEADLESIAHVERLCFPESEAATKELFADRLTYYPNHFWLLEDGEMLAGFINGMVTDLEHLSDVMYADAGLHDEYGAWQMIFGLDVAPACRGRGYAGLLLHRLIADAREQGRKGLVLTCKEALVGWYAGFGFRDEGISSSVHGGVVWHEMRLTFSSCASGS